MSQKLHHPDTDIELSVAEAFVLLTLEWPVRIDPLIAWSDADTGLVGALLIDLSLSGLVDSDLKILTVVERASSLEPAQAFAYATLQRVGQAMPLDVALNVLIDRAGDLRMACLASLESKKICLTTSHQLNWDFQQLSISQSRKAEASKLRRALAALVESDELPLPQEASLISLLNVCEIIGPLLGGKSYQYWLLTHQPRIDLIGRMELVSGTLIRAVREMRLRLRTYLLDASEEPVAPGTNENASVNASGGGLYQRTTTTWEWRAFWPKGEPVLLPVSWLEITSNLDLVEETNEDRYLFVHGKRDNLKIRGKNLKIKPVLEAFDDFIAFGPSAKFDFPEKALLLSSVFPRLFEVRGKLRSVEELLQVLTATGYQPGMVTVSKVRQGVSMMFGVQVEFARIELLGKVYHSISLESPYLTPLRILARKIAVARADVAGYSDFLEHMLRNVHAD